jgi:hypothetical protein
MDVFHPIPGIIKLSQELQVFLLVGSVASWFSQYLRRLAIHAFATFLDSVEVGALTRGRVLAHVFNFFDFFLEVVNCCGCELLRTLCFLYRRLAPR